MRRIRPAARRQIPFATTTAAAIAITLTVAGCSSSDDSSNTSTSTTSSSSTSSSTTPVISTEAVAGSGDVLALAKTFAATLTASQKKALYQDYTFTNAADWSNFPQGLLTGAAMAGGVGTSGGASGAPAGMTGRPDGASGAPAGMTGAPGGASGATSAAGGGGVGGGTGRVGLQTGTLTDKQWVALENLIAAATGSKKNEGYDEVLQHFDADDYLEANGGGDTYGRGNFYIAYLGTPTDSGTWELQFGGHHLAIANTYDNGEMTGATPSFRGIEPFTTVSINDTTVEPEQQEQEAFASLLTSFDTSQASSAKLTSSFSDILLGPGTDWAFPTKYEGVAGSDMTAKQKKLLLAAIDTYVDDVDDADAKTILATYKSQLDKTYVSYSGTTGMKTIGDYIRIDGPRVWIEFSMQNGVVLTGAHPHAVWRDKVSDYGGLTK